MAYIAKDKKDPGPISPGPPGQPGPKELTNRELLLLNRDLLLKIAEKLGVATE